MAEVKWIKITTDMFDNRKIKHLRKLPDGNNVVLIWVMLLTMAGRCNANGMIFLTENIPYTPKMLADELDFEENTVNLALQALEQLGMVITNNGFFTISGWEEYQNIEGMERIREQARKRMAKYREKQKNIPCNVTVTSRYAVEEEREEEIEEEREIEVEGEKEEKPAHTATHTKSSINYDSLVKQYGKSFVDERIQRARNYKGTTMETVAKWCKEDYGKKNKSQLLVSDEYMNVNRDLIDKIEKKPVMAKDDPKLAARAEELKKKCTG